MPSRKICFSSVLSVLLVSSVASPLFAGDLSKKEKDAGFVSLFNG